MNDRVELTPLSGIMGARVDGIDLTDELDDETFAQVRTALTRYKVLLFPAQSLDPAAHVALGRRFGEIVENHPDYPTIDGQAQIMVIENGPERPPDNEYWHKDMTYRPDPPHCSLLQAKVLPSRGGDTMFADMEAALADLSPAMRAWLESLNVVHDQLVGFEPTLLANEEFERLANMRAHPPEMRCNVHPAVGRHPISGNKYLGIDDCFVSHFVELEAAESDALLKMLREHLKHPKYQVRIGWRVDDLVVWDNVNTLHYAIGDYSEYRRMQRVTVKRYHDAV